MIAAGTVALPAVANVETQRELFTEARKAVKKGHMRTFARLTRQLKDYPLYGYLQYEYLRKKLRRVSDAQIHEFIEDYSDSPISSRLRSRWLHYLARKRRWKKFLEEYQPSQSTRLKCYYGRALFARGETEKAMKVAQELWLVGRSQPKVCDPVFEQWVKRGGKTTEMVWGRIRLAMAAGRLSLAKFLAKELPKSEQVWVVRWRNMHRRPAANLHRRIFKEDSPLVRDIVRHGIKRLARRDAGAAFDVWDTLRAEHSRKEPEVSAKLDRYLAVKGAYQRHPQALEWLSRVNQEEDEFLRGWRVRTALSQQDWWSALTWIEALPVEERNADQWRYWRGRILEMQSINLPVLRTAAERIFADLSEERSYHGFLAADHIGRPYHLEADPLEFSEDELAAIAEVPGLKRAHELFRVKLYADARREWHWTIRNFTPRQLQMAAVLAGRWGWHDRAIITVAKTQHFDDLDLRFPTAYRSEIQRHASDQKVDPAWVYGVMRQESSFMADARSHAGALGLMQLMPRTGRITARQIKSRLRSSKELLQVEKNIKIGTAYLRRMLDRNDGHSVLATASYNAGPHRVSQWKPKVPMEADLWVETIPFTETRRYVQRVMAYTVIYDYKLNNAAEVNRINQRMRLIQPADG